MQWGRALRKISSSKIDSARGGAGREIFVVRQVLDARSSYPIAFGEVRGGG